MADPRTTREALIAEVLGDLDALLERAEALPHRIGETEAKLKRTAAALDDAGDKYRLAVTAFSEQARSELTDYLQRLAVRVAARTVEQQRAALQEAALSAFRSEASNQATQLDTQLGRVTKELRRTASSRLLEHGVTALLASLLTGVVVFSVVRWLA